MKDAYFCDVTWEYSLIFYSSVKHKDTGMFLGMIGIRILASELDNITLDHLFEVTSSPVPSPVEEKKEYLFSRGQTYFKPQVVETPQTAHEKDFKMQYGSVSVYTASNMLTSRYGVAHTTELNR